MTVCSAVYNHELAAVLRELMQREPIFHRPELGTTREDFARMMVEDYWETGASGKQYDRLLILDMLEERNRSPRGRFAAPDKAMRKADPSTSLRMTPGCN